MLPHDVDLVQALPQVPRILDMCAELTGMGFIAIARVTDTHWMTCAARDTLGFGLRPGDELVLDTTICKQVRGAQAEIVFGDAEADAQWRDHQTPKLYGFRSYISVPIVLPDGRFFGTLCAIDPAPRKLERPEIVGTFRLFAELIGLAVAKEEELAESRSTARLREEFIAVVGHDLRNPIAAVGAGLNLLQKRYPEAATGSLVREMRSALHRAGAIISNLLDFARGRLGGALELELEDAADVGGLIEGVAREIATGTEAPVVVALGPLPALRCDPVRIGQLLSNLVSNAVTHGAVGEPVSVEAAFGDGRLTILVTNRGAPIPPAHLERLFLPFERGDGAGRRDGLGLGLHISQQIARAHGGAITVQSSKIETRFTVTLPLAPAPPVSGASPLPAAASAGVPDASPPV